MTQRELVTMCCEEACERAMKAYTDALDACIGEDIPLTPRQRLIVGTSMLNSFIGIEDALAGMVRASDAIGRFDMTPIADEIEAWLADHDGPA